MAKYYEGMKYGQMVDTMVDAGSNQELAQEFFNSYVDYIMSTDAITDANSDAEYKEKATALVSHNLGYLMGYAPDSINIKMWQEIGANHPIFGSSLSGSTEEIADIAEKAVEETVRERGIRRTQKDIEEIIAGPAPLSFEGWLTEQITTAKKSWGLTDDVHLLFRIIALQDVREKMHEFPDPGMLENKIELLEEDLECVHMWLDKEKAPREGTGGTYSIVGRIQQLMGER